MLKDERLKEIETMLQTNGKVEVGNLCRIFNVTEMTIRRDLNDLVARNLAVGPPPAPRAPPPTKRKPSRARPCNLSATATGYSSTQAPRSIAWRV